MRKEKTIRYANPRMLIIVLLPLIILLWLIGWSLFWAGSKPHVQFRPQREIGVVAILVETDA